MARNDTIQIPAGAWTQITNADALAVRVQNISSLSIWLQATNGAAAPADQGGAVVVQPMAVLAADMTIAQLWPGVAGANRLWVYADRAASITVSHADA